MEQRALTFPRVEEAIQELCLLEQLDLFVDVPEPPAREVLRQAGAGVFALVEAALANASGTGRVALMQVLIELDPERARPLIAALASDETPAVVSTCLRRFTTVSSWAASTLHRLDGLERRRQAMSDERAKKTVGPRVPEKSSAYLRVLKILLFALCAALLSWLVLR